MDFKVNMEDGAALPDWLPQAARHYLIHTQTGQSIRALARQSGCHASTVLRQIRRYENRRDDPLIDAGLRQLSDQLGARDPEAVAPADSVDLPSISRINSEAERVLRRLCEPGAVLAVARDMDKAVVVRDEADGENTRTAVIDVGIAQIMALRDWISCSAPGARIARYQISASGRAALKKLMAAAENRAQGFAEAKTGFDGPNVLQNSAKAPRHLRYNYAENPLIGLARRKDKNGKPFLSKEQVRAGERLREDFELSQLGPNATQDWDRFLSSGAAGYKKPGDKGSGAMAARDRVAAALSDLGPGLGDVALRCCCYLEGMEVTEKRMGWSARSGKIVLRIALQRLIRHYQETQGKFAPKIG